MWQWFGCFSKKPDHYLYSVVLLRVMLKPHKLSIKNRTPEIQIKYVFCWFFELIINNKKFFAGSKILYSYCSQKKYQIIDASVMSEECFQNDVAVTLFNY